MKTKITISEIARKSGVSVSTVSRVLNNSPSVSPEKREKIQQIIAEHNYTPSVFARGMVNHTSQNIGVILPDITNPYFASLFMEVQRFALLSGYATLLFNTMFVRNRKQEVKKLSEEDYFRIIQEKQVDGVLVLGGHIDKEDIQESFIQALNQLHRQIPVVIVGSRIDGCDCLVVERNLKQGVAAIVHHFIALGHERIGFIGGEPGIRITSARIEAFKQEMRALGKPALDHHIIPSDYYAPDGYEAMMQLLEESRETLPTAVIAMNDMVAIGAIRAMKDRGLSCPEHIAIASCDQFPQSEYTIPRLTSLDQHNEYLGRMAVLQLISAMNGSEEMIHINHTPKLIIRESCGA
ncbi:LacI family DNA-binding transcriptional regulator [Paenibacillus sp. GCM10012307]|uniref:LacI family DNA-binding transcriptional regulator n=1 Tax=Paenibacillus roseus TaxID=2798579 RepID=A0A934MTE8_9BACL|nr:LacI family DNA-binding transcriptional regulator [Paenibacillus roseus]MBJ6359997.1 LacI family DNA-binding transcriptional regulator [Paenibacillus roseus]